MNSIGEKTQILYWFLLSSCTKLMYIYIILTTKLCCWFVLYIRETNYKVKRYKTNCTHDSVEFSI